MKIKSFSLPARYRLELKLVKRRKNLDERPLLLKLEDLRRVRKGSKLSRFLCHLLEHKKARRFLGVNMALVAIFGSMFPNIETSVSADNIEIKNIIFAEVETIKNVQYPIEIVKVNQGYAFYHPGVDFDGNTGDEVKPFKKGAVLEVGYSNFGYGNAVLIEHENNLTSLYAHLSEINVEKGELVDTASVVGKVGSTGRSTGAHLHFEIRHKSIPVNPFNHLP